jgi:hypothetical protein
MVDLDSINDWAQSFYAAQTENVSETVRAKMVAAAPRLIEDALDKLFDLTNRGAVIAATLEWIRSSTIAAYHGTRLTDSEVASVRANGLIPLRASARKVRLERALSRHPSLQNVSEKLDSTIAACAGGREGRVTLAFSRSALTDCYNHYLTYGAEFDQCVAEELLGQEGIAILANDGNRMLIRIGVPGDTALRAANPYWTAEEILARGEVPQLAREFLKAWSYDLANPDRAAGPLRISCDMALDFAVPPEWINSIEALQNRP